MAGTVSTLVDSLAVVGTRCRRWCWMSGPQLGRADTTVAIGVEGGVELGVLVLATTLARVKLGALALLW